MLRLTKIHLKFHHLRLIKGLLPSDVGDKLLTLSSLIIHVCATLGATVIKSINFIEVKIQCMQC